MELVAVLGAVFVLLVVGYFGVSAVLQRIPTASLRLPTGPIPDSWHGIVERNVPLSRGLSADERERLLRLVQIFLTDKHFEGCGGLTLTEEIKVTIAAGACLFLLPLPGPCHSSLPAGVVYSHRLVSQLPRAPRAGGVAPPPPPP